MSTTLQRLTSRRFPFIPFPRRDDDFAMNVRRLADDFFDPAVGAEPVGLFPAIEISENDDAFLCTAELPGIAPKDVQLTFENGMLNIRGEKKDEHETSDKRYHVLERSYGAFQRSFTFPVSVKSDKISAEFKNGVLIVRLPKAAKAEMAATKIEITTK
jgi:HSP20 family protein